jgi:tetratricopeptide (TPR) repeat protein
MARWEFGGLINVKMQLKIGVSLFLLFVSNLLAGTVKIKITDDQDKAVEGAEIRLVKLESGEALTVVSSAEGLASLEANPPGAYKLMIRKTGYLPLVLGKVDVSDAVLNIEPRLVTQEVFEQWSKGADAAVKKKKYQDALSLYQKILVYFPQDGGFWANLATTHQLNGNPEAAMQAAEKAAKLDTQYQGLEKKIVGVAGHEAGKKYLAQKQFEKAAELFNKSVKADPTYAPAFYGLALSYANQGLYPQALESVRKALELNPNEAEYKTIEQRLKEAVAGR